jgi:hypothetical protein
MPALAAAIARRQPDILDLATRHGDVLNRVCSECRWDLASILLSAGATWSRPVSGRYHRPALETDLGKTPLGVAVRSDDPKLLDVLGSTWSHIHTETLILAARFKSSRLGDALWSLRPPASALDHVPPRVLFWNQAWLDNWIKAKPSWSGALVFQVSDWIGPKGWKPPEGLKFLGDASPGHAVVPASGESLLIPDVSVAPNDPVARALPMFDRLAKLCGPSVVRRPTPRQGGRPKAPRASVDWMSLVAGVLARGDVGRARSLARAHAMSPVLLTQMALSLLTVRDQFDLCRYVGSPPEGPGPLRAALSFLAWSAPRISPNDWARAWGNIPAFWYARVSLDATQTVPPLPVEPLAPTFVALFQRDETLAREVLDLFQAAGSPLPVIQKAVGAKCPGLSQEIAILVDREILRRSAGLVTGKQKKTQPVDAPPPPTVPPPRRRAM